MSLVRTIFVLLFDSLGLYPHSPNPMVVTQCEIAPEQNLCLIRWSFECGVAGGNVASDVGGDIGG